MKGNKLRREISRKRLYEIIEVCKADDKVGLLYDYFMMITIVISLIPLLFKSTNKFLVTVENLTVYIFIIDYFFRVITADYKLNNKGLSFIKYPFTPMAIVDLISILPSVTFISSVFRTLKIFRLFRVMRVFKTVRYSKSINMIRAVFIKQKPALITVGNVAMAYILISALIVFNIEPDTFKNFFEAFYWATTALTTVGYGDIYPVSVYGRIVGMISSLFGIAVVALPAGIITAGYMDEMEKYHRNKN